MTKLDYGQKHILSLIVRDASADGWASVSEVLCKSVSKEIPDELVTFEKLEVGGRIKLTDEGQNVVDAMKWL